MSHVAVQQRVQRLDLIPQPVGFGRERIGRHVVDAQVDLLLVGGGGDDLRVMRNDVRGAQFGLGIIDEIAGSAHITHDASRRG